MNKELLPIGTVVLLKESKEPLMITGYCVYQKESDEMQIYDYGSCKYPIGIVDGNVSFAFNEENIEKILYEGYKSEVYDEFSKVLIENYEIIKSGLKETQ